MRTTTGSLVWKEWHEHKWKLASLTAILWGGATLTMLDHDNDILVGVGAMLVLCIVPLAIFIGLGTAAGERSRRTLQFTQALPLPIWRFAIVKMAAGLATILLAVILAVLFVFVWCKCLDLLGIEYSRQTARKSFEVAPFSFGADDWFVDTTITLAVMGASFYLWTIFAGVNRKDEATAGAVALAAMAGWAAILVLTGVFLVTFLKLFVPWNASLSGAGEWLFGIAISTVPSGVAAIFRFSASYFQALVILVVATATHIALAVWYVRRYGRADAEVRSPQPAAKMSKSYEWLEPPRRSPMAAIAWKQYRESGPIVLAGLAAMVGTAVVFLAPNLNRAAPPGETAEIVVSIIVLLGAVIAVVLGIGAMQSDIAPRINAFWRSRPIQPDMWFWCKFVTGLAILLASLYAPMLLVLSLSHPDARHSLFDGNELVVSSIHIAIFAAAMAMMCIVRQPVYAGIFSIAILYLSIALVWVGLQAAKLAGWLEQAPQSVLDLSEGQVMAGFIGCFVVCTLAGWLALRNDWGRNSRY